LSWPETRQESVDRHPGVSDPAQKAKTLDRDRRLRIPLALPPNRAAARRERKVRGRRALSFAPLEEKSGQESAAARRNDPADFRERRPRLPLKQMREERLRQDKARFAAADGQRA